MALWHGSDGGFYGPDPIDGAFLFNQTRAQAIQGKAVSGNLKNLTAQECINAYNIAYESNYGDFIAVSHDENLTEPIGYAVNPSFTYPTSWLCGNITTNINVRPKCSGNVKILSEHWTLNYQAIDYCLVDVLDFEECELKFNLWLLAAVIIANLGKLCCMIAMLIVYDIPTLVTLGDAISSFIQVPERKTKGACVLGRDDFKRMAFWKNPFSIPSVWTKQRKRWYNASSITHWIVTITM